MKSFEDRNRQTGAHETPVTFVDGHLKGPPVSSSKKLLGDLKGIFQDEKAFEEMDSNQKVYEVEVWMPVTLGTQGGLFFGVTHLYPGTVNSEYFMTHGHFHSVENRAEYYWGVEGNGLLLLMGNDRQTRAERMYPGSLHYIPGHTAHRVVNTGDQTLKFGACWPSDAGHNYKLIGTEGFSKRVIKVNDTPTLV